MPETLPSPEVVAVRIPSRLELLGLLDSITLSLCERMKMDDSTCSQVTMSVIEAGTNAIQHGHSRDASKSVDIEYELFPDRLEVRVHDEGRGFDPGAVNGDVTAPEHLFDARGRGIYIMKACMDSVTYEFGEHGTTCVLVKHRPPDEERGA